VHSGRSPLVTRSAVIRLAIAALLLTIGGTAGACGGSGGPSLEGYFKRLDVLNENLATQLEGLETEFPQAFVEPSATLDYYTKLNEADGEYLQQLNDVDVPTKVAEVHGQFARAKASLHFLRDRLLVKLAEVKSAAELQQVLDTNKPDPSVVEKGISACLELQQIADSSGIDVKLDCTA